MKNQKQMEKIRKVELIIEPSEETIDFTDFVREILEFQMVRACVVSCFVNLEKPQGSGKSK